MKIATIADIHFNAVKPGILLKQLNDVFLEYLRNHEIDMVVIAGDYYDSIISLNSQSAIVSITFMEHLMKIAEEKGIKYIRIIKGTSSHDNNQLENLRLFEKSSSVDLRIFDTVTSESLKGKDILYIPEEYMKNVGEYYEEYFSKTYDMIFGHGMFKETSFNAMKQESAITLSKAPVFDSKMMSSICRGPIIFGHIHVACSIGKQITYVGSFSRWVYGEEQPKGFLVTELTDKKFTNTFIENTLAEKYDTATTIVTESTSFEPESFIEKMKGLLKDHLRIIIVLSGDKDYSYEIGFLREYYSRRPEYKLVITDKSQVMRKVAQEEKIDELREKYDFVFSPTIARTEKIHRFIKVRDKEEIDENEIKKVLRMI